MLLEADYDDDLYQAEIYLDTGEGFADTAKSFEEPSSAYRRALRSLLVNFAREPVFDSEEFTLKEYSTENDQVIATWESRIPRYKYDLENIEYFVLPGSLAESAYRFFVNEEKWPLIEKDNVLYGKNPGVLVEQPGSFKIIEATGKKEKEIDENEELSPGFDGIAYVDQTAEPIAIESISMERYFGTLDFYLPLSIKTWDAEKLMEDFQPSNSDEAYSVEEGIFYLDVGQPQLSLQYTGDFSRTYAEIDQRLASLDLLIKLGILAFSLGVFFFSGLLFNNLQRISRFVITWLKASLSSINNRLALLFFGLIASLLLVSATFLKVIFFGLALITGLFILYLNRGNLVENNFWPGENSGRYAFIVFMVIFILGAFIFTYQFGEHDLREDEFFVVDAAGGYYHAGDYYCWDFINNEPGENVLGETYYDRAFPHTYLMAQTYNIFGISEFSTRLVSVLFGIFFIPVYYITAKYFTENKYLALLAVGIAIFYELYIFTFRYARMYSLLLPLFLLLVYFTYRGLTENNISNPSSRLKAIVYHNFNYQYYYLLAGLGLLVINYLLHVNALIILPSAFLFVLLMFYLAREKRHLNLIYLGLAGIAAMIPGIYFNIFERYLWGLSFFERRNYDYIEYLAGYPFPWELSALFLVLGGVAVALMRHRLKYKIVYLYTITIFTLIFFIYIGDRYSQLLYTSHVTPLVILLILFACYMLTRAINSKTAGVLLLALIFFYAGTGFYQNIDIHYKDAHDYGSFSSAYEVITDHYDPEKEVIFGQYLRDYYLQDLQDKTVETICMLNNKRYSYERFHRDLLKYEAGWITWETRKSYHLEEEIIEFIDNNFEKLHGEGVDDSKVEVYYYEHDMFK